MSRQMPPAPLAARFPEADRLARSRWGLVAIAVHDTKTGTIWHNEVARAPIRSASIVKGPILLSFLEMKCGGDPARLSPTERADAEAMIRRSDNNATTRFWNKVGGAKVMDWMNQTSQLPDAHLAPENAAWWGYSHITAANMAAILAKAASRRVVTPAACDYLLSEMRSVTPDQRWGIPDGSSTPAQVAVKNGWYPEDDEKVWRVHSTGVAPIGDDKDRAVVVILTRYPLAMGMRYGQDTCRLVATAILQNFPQAG